MRRAATVLMAAQGRHIPALALTACAGPHDVQEAARAGFEAHVAKPVLPEELVRVVAQLGSHAAPVPS